MADNYFLVIDAGTGGGRCLIFDEEGKLHTIAYEEWIFDTPAEVAPLGKEFNPDKFWEIICKVSKQALKQANLKPDQIRAISATSFREGSVFIDRNGKELYAGPATDLRALSEGMNIKTQFGKKVYQLTGHTPPFMFASARLKWFKEKRTDIYNQIHRVLMMNDWILFKFSGEAYTEPTNACETELFDIHTLTWSKEILDLLELRDDIFPDIVMAGTKIGEVTKRAAAETSLKEGTPVIMAGADSQCSMLGMGLIEEGQMGIIAGTTLPLQMIVSRPIIDEKTRIWTNNYLLSNKWIIESHAGDSGKVYRWFRDNVADYERITAIQQGKNAFDLLNDLAKDVAPGSEGIFAFLGPMIIDFSAVGPMGYGGFLIPMPLFMGNYGKKQFVRAFLENMAFAIFGACLQLEEISQLKLNEANMCGGLANSEVLVQIIADTLRIPIKTYQTVEATGLGTAICAALGSGVYSNIPTAIANMVHLKKVIEPGPNQKIYKKLFKKWLKIYEKLQQIPSPTGL
ncbi:MAG TPA: FGGY family carbohydrate kinase [Candidatus Deferrimicrobium sp.]|nr:FGGY family carbohydrate kinase [Candidatus Deferrimicrobium sp.]